MWRIVILKYCEHWTHLRPVHKIIKGKPVKNLFLFWQDKLQNLVCTNLSVVGMYDLTVYFLFLFNQNQSNFILFFILQNAVGFHFGKRDFDIKTRTFTLYIFFKLKYKQFTQTKAILWYVVCWLIISLLVNFFFFLNFFSKSE